MNAIRMQSREYLSVAGAIHHTLAGIDDAHVLLIGFLVVRQDCRFQAMTHFLLDALLEFQL